MRGHVVVDEEDDFKAWLKTHPTYAQTVSGVGAAAATVGLSMVEQGRTLAESGACMACHTTDGSTGLGPTWQGLFGKTETLADGTTIVVDEDYLKESILNPNAKVVQGFAPVMPPGNYTDAELDALITYIKDGLDEDSE
jgi:cytochrome c oxidase subunit 2